MHSYFTVFQGHYVIVSFLYDCFFIGEIQEYRRGSSASWQVELHSLVLHLFPSCGPSFSLSPAPLIFSWYQSIRCWDLTGGHLSLGRNPSKGFPLLAQGSLSHSSFLCSAQTIPAPGNPRYGSQHRDPVQADLPLSCLQHLFHSGVRHPAG